jgi:hypothetical protein
LSQFWFDFTGSGIRRDPFQFDLPEETDWSGILFDGRGMAAMQGWVEAQKR